jgi:uncharacterized protein YkwD
MGEALAFATAAGAAQVAESVAEQNARNNAPVAHAYGAGVTPCDNDHQYACLSVGASPGEPPRNTPQPEMTDEEARDYVLGYVNGVRKLNAEPPLARDPDLDAFAQAGSEELSQDHSPGAHLAGHAQELPATSAEVQGAPDGAAPGPLQDQIAGILLPLMAEGAGGTHHDMLLRPSWRKLGVGLLKRDGRLFFTVDFSN